MTVKGTRPYYAIFPDASSDESSSDGIWAILEDSSADFDEFAETYVPSPLPIEEALNLFDEDAGDTSYNPPTEANTNPFHGGTSERTEANTNPFHADTSEKTEADINLFPGDTSEKTEAGFHADTSEDPPLAVAEHSSTMPEGGKTEDQADEGIQPTFLAEIYHEEESDDLEFHFMPDLAASFEMGQPSLTLTRSRRRQQPQPSIVNDQAGSEEEDSGVNGDDSSDDQIVQCSQQ